jgi:hypothetical protein
MRKWMVISILFCCLLFPSHLFAHLSGVLGDFLVGIKDESTNERLKTTIDITKKEIEKLKPQNELIKNRYNQEENKAISKIKFYTSSGIDSFIGFALESHDIVNILANERIIEKNLDEYLQELNTLYVSYMELKATNTALESYDKLLNMIKNNLDTRKQFIEKHAAPDLPKQDQLGWLKLKIEFAWETNTAFITINLNHDSVNLNKSGKTLFTQKTKTSPYRLDESAMNKISKMQYYFQSDHIYLHYHKDDADIILIGIISKDNEQTASIKFEAGFLNGIMVPWETVSKMPGLVIDYGKLNPQSTGFYVEQTNSSIVLQPYEKAME